MAEEPTANPEPLPWGTEETPFPVGTRFNGPDDFSAKVTRVDEGTQPIVFVDGMGLMPKEIQGRIEESGWEPHPPA
jgi:hypothetical protein